MDRLKIYVNRCFNYCKDSAGKAKEIHLAHAFGACEMYAILNPDAGEEVRKIWENKWYPQFTEEIWGYRP